MATKTKLYTVGFYKIADRAKLMAALSAHIQKSLNVKNPSKSGYIDYLYYVDSCNIVNSNLYSLNKLRLSDIPKKVNFRNKSEEDINIGKHEGILERLYFYVSDTYLIAQYNGSVCWGSSIHVILSDIIGLDSKSVAPIAGERDLLDDDMVSRIDIGVVFNEAMRDEDFGKHKDDDPFNYFLRAFSGLSRTNIDLHGGYQNVELLLSFSNSLEKKVTGKWFRGNYERLMAAVSGKSKVKRVKANVRNEDRPLENEGRILVLDMLGLYKKAQIRVLMQGHYPDINDIADKLEKCR